MQTNNIKSFAKEARKILIEGVKNRIKFWGFDEEGNTQSKLESTPGGYIFRGQVYNDPSVPAKWEKLRKRLKNKHAVQDVIEETAYTWFNRLMAIKILETNGFLPLQLAYTKGTRTPAIVQNAKRGQHELIHQSFIDLLQEFLRENKEEQAFGLLLTRLCNNHKLLHDVFGRIDDYTEILLPQNLLQKDGMLDILNSDIISAEDYKEVELIGWLYQFYISDKKDKVFADFKKNIKARAEDIPAATQIFTPKWIVKYMVENTVGKIYLDYEPGSSLRGEMKYLVENENDQDAKPIISDIKELTLLDPASGSGHILVTGFDLLFKMYREEGYTARQAVESILKHNIFGLDIDDRAMQLARFAVLLKAASYDAGILDRGIIPHIYSFPEESHFISEELQTFLGSEGYTHIAELKEALHLLNQGKNIGSALKLTLSNSAREHIETQYNLWLTKSETASLDLEAQGIWQRLKPFLEVLLVLTRQYASVVANPPYMGQKNMNGELKAYINDRYPNSKSDLFAVFIEAMIEMVKNEARMGCITMESWMFLSSYEKLREYLLNNYSIVSLAHFGWHIIGIAFGTAALILEKSKNIRVGEYSYLTIDDIERKDNLPFEFPKKDNGRFAKITQTKFHKVPGSPIAYWVKERERDLYEHGLLFSNYCYPKKGIDTGENAYFLRQWYEIDLQNLSYNKLDKNKKWFPYNKGGEFRRWYGNRDIIVNWANNGEEIKSRLSWSKKKPTIRNSQYHFREGFSWTTVSSSGFTCRYVPEGCLFDNGGCTLFADKELYFFGSLLNSKVAKRYFDFLSPTLNFQPGDIGRMLYYEPNEKYSSIKELTKASIVISKKDYDSREISWDFAKSALLNSSSSIKRSFENWERDVTHDFFQLHSNEVELNRIFIDIYGLQDELTPDVHLKDITILKDELDTDGLEKLEPIFQQHGKEAIALPIKKEEVLSQFISYCVGLIMGRYRLDKPGLNIAHPNPSDEELAQYTYNGQTIKIDDDAIVPIMGNDCNFPDDVLVQLKHFLLAIWGEETLTENLNFLQETLDMDLHKWITEKFWGYHTGMYKKKPIYWLFTSNPDKPHKAAFRVLVYMHRMNRYTVQQIQRNYFYPHQEYIGREINKLKDVEETLGKQELKRLEMLQDWEIECRNYNEVLKDFANRQIEFDLDDGVSVNYAKFEGAVAKIK